MSMTHDEQKIRQVFDGLTAAWNQGDIQAFSSFFTDDCDYVTFAGAHLVGQKANADAHETLFRGILRGSKLIGTIQSIRFVTPDMAIVHGQGAVQMRWQKKAPQSRASINTNVFVRQNGDWKITAFHNSRIQRPGLFQKLFLKIFS